MTLTRRAFIAASAAPLASPAQTGKPRLRRKDCFLGFHFDLHPSLRDNALGRDVTDEMVEQFLAKTKPDYVQYDYKGHVGYVGYPSKVSTSAPNIKDSLEVWRRVTARNGVALFIHFSGVLDGLAVQDHPEWARLDAAGERDRQQTSTFGPYVDERMIPQLKEAIEKYDVDGVWVDGECWGTKPDYSPAAVKAWREASGMEPPKKPGDPGWQQFLEFHRQQFRKYVKHYADVLHAFKPTFQIASNWLYTTYVPERPELPVDYLSGDYLGNASISTARLEARYLDAVGKPWDLMAWGFQRGGAEGISHKPSMQLNQEAMIVLMQGGGFQVYYQPTRAGKLDEKLVDVMTKVASFCRARQALSHKSESVPQIGLVFSKKSLYEYTAPPPRPARPGAPPQPEPAPRLFGGWGNMVNPARGLLDALVENHYSVDVIPDWKLAEVAAQYPMLAVPDWGNLGEETKEVLAGYVNKGGQMLLVGAANGALFARELGVTLTDRASDQPAFVTGEEVFGNMRGLWQDVEPGSAEVIESRYPTYDATRDAKCAATLSKFGAGRIAAIYGPVGGVFAATHAAAPRQFVKRVVDRIFKPMAQVEGPPTVDVALRRKNGKLLLHLGNCTGMQVAADYSASDFVPAVGPLRISVRMQQKPARVTLEPQGRALAGSWKDGVWSGTLDRLDVHAIVAFSA
jgi:hypothetical protein